jgi:hypothetical protein
VGDQLKKYKVRTRNGYRPQPSRFSSALLNEPGAYQRGRDNH